MNIKQTKIINKMKTSELLKIYQRKLEGAELSVEIAISNTDSTPCESEEEAEFLFEKADKQLIAAKQKVEDIKEFISDLKLYSE